MFFFKKVSYIYIYIHIYIYAATFIHIHTSCKFPVSMPVFPSAAAPKSGWHAGILSPDIHLKKKKTMQYCIATYYIAISCSPKETQCSHIIYIHIPFRKISSNLTWQWQITDSSTFFPLCLITTRQHVLCSFKTQPCPQHHSSMAHPTFDLRKRLLQFPMAFWAKSAASPPPLW